VTATVTELHPSNSAYPLPAGQVNGPQLAARAGVTYCQVDYWTRAGYLQPHGPPRPGSGYQRAYPESEIPLAALMRDLLAAGLMPEPAHYHARQLLEHGTTRIAGITIHLPQEL
jgi:hypothetical protein